MGLSFYRDKLLNLFTLVLYHGVAFDASNV